jgi:quercetin dioxygenase-like cupin family protein
MESTNDIGTVRSPRRVVTGLREDGSSYLARVEFVEEIDYSLALPGGPHGESGTKDLDPGADRGGFFRIWGADRLPVPLPTDGLAPVFDTEPSGSQTQEALRRATTMPPPLGVRISWSRHLTQGPPGPFHFTDSTDILFVMAGQRGEILDRGELVLRAGDVLVQNGTAHAHESISEEATVLGYVVVGALRVGEHPPIDLLHAVSQPLGGHRSGETPTKQPPPAWSVPAAAPGTYEGQDRGALSAADVVAPRRAVTGTDADGKSYWARVEPIAEVDYAEAGLGDQFEHQLWRVWGIDQLPDFAPSSGTAAPLRSHPSQDETPEALRRAPLAPEPLGVVVAVTRILPTAAPSPMRWQNTMDAIFIMSGEVTYLLDGGEEIDLRAGDVLIQNGTNHAWHNRTSEPVLAGFASFAGVRTGQSPPAADYQPLRP